MLKILKIKDPLYGYVNIAGEDIYKIINSSQFHRLKRIIQTSYTAVYPSATHNRFTHSIGVYYLGTLAMESLKKELGEKKFDKKDIDSYCKTFLLACLLHDVGHSPFSHSGEKYYAKENIWEQLIKQLSDEQFTKDANGKTKGAEHEIMSSLLAISCYWDILNKFDKSLFVRCIIGLKYSDKNDVRNCFIDLLNSETIDVDKLDYLIRDTMYTGFASVTIDYKRLLSSVCIIQNREETSLGFKKSALSTLESVVLARDMEKKWIQNHPVIKYESFLVDHMISSVNKYYENLGIKVFCLNALTTDGISCKDKFYKLPYELKEDDIFKKFQAGKDLSKNEQKSLRDKINKGSQELNKIRLLSDSDIIYVAKNCIANDECIDEYFDRNLRKKALWKSEAEYKLHFSLGTFGPEIIRKLNEKINSIEKVFNTLSTEPFINENLLKYFEEELRKNSENKEPIMQKISKQRAEEIQSTIDFIMFFKRYSEANDIKFNFAILSDKQYNTGFTKMEFKNIKIQFETGVKNLSEVVQVLESKKIDDTYFYIYANNKDILDNKINVTTFLKELNTYCIQKS